MVGWGPVGRRNPATYSLTGASGSSRPSSTSRIAAVAVAIFDIENQR